MSTVFISSNVFTCRDREREGERDTQREREREREINNGQKK